VFVVILLVVLSTHFFTDLTTKSKHITVPIFITLYIRGNRMFKKKKHERNIIRNQLTNIFKIKCISNYNI